MLGFGPLELLILLFFGALVVGPLVGVIVLLVVLHRAGRPKE